MCRCSKIQRKTIISRSMDQGIFYEIFHYSGKSMSVRLYKQGFFGNLNLRLKTLLGEIFIKHMGGGIQAFFQDERFTMEVCFPLTCSGSKNSCSDRVPPGYKYRLQSSRLRARPQCPADNPLHSSRSALFPFFSAYLPYSFSS